MSQVSMKPNLRTRTHLRQSHICCHVYVCGVVRGWNCMSHVMYEAEFKDWDTFAPISHLCVFYVYQCNMCGVVREWS